jgi:hypothetical protein
VVTYEVPFTCGPNPPPGVELVLVEGLASGSILPLRHNADRASPGGWRTRNLVNLCSFNVTVSDEFCAPQIQFFVEPITHMVVAGVDHVIHRGRHRPRP